MIPQTGDTVLITPQAGAQFRIFGRGMLLQVSSVKRHSALPDYMVYLSGYRIDADGTAIEKRPELLVEHAGVELVKRSTAGRPRNSGPARIPQQRRPNEVAGRPDRRQARA